jgi:protocatechuate 3,4-dioxygenase beta subunit
VDWSRTKIPENVRVRDERASASGVDLSSGSVIQAEFFDMDTGKVIGGAHLLVEKVSWQTNAPAHWETTLFADAMSDSSGRVQVQNIPADPIRISVTANNYAPLRLDQRGHARAALLKFSVELAKVASLRGTVIDADGRPLKKAKVGTFEILASNGRAYGNGFYYDPYESADVETDDAGRFELKGLPKGFAQVRARASGYFFSDSATIHDVPATNIVLRLARAGGIQVTIADKNGKALSRLDGNPLLVNVEAKEGTKVGSWGGGATVKDDGTYEFADVPPGEYRVISRPNPSTSNKQYSPEQVITVTGGRTETVKIIYE